MEEGRHEPIVETCRTTAEDRQERLSALRPPSVSSQLPTPAERVTLALNNLVEKKIEFPKNGNGTQVHQCIVEQFPQLDQRGYSISSILRTTSESRRSRDLMKIPMLSAPGGWGLGILPYVAGMCGPKWYGFLAVLVRTRVLI